jgi:hypothetical protein
MENENNSMDSYWNDFFSNDFLTFYIAGVIFGTSLHFIIGWAFTVG